MTEIEFVDELPTDGSRQTRLHREEMREFANALREQPGRWAKLPWETTELSSRATASRISLGKVAAFGTGYEAVSTRGTVYVRYHGVGE